MIIEWCRLKEGSGKSEVCGHGPYTSVIISGYVHTCIGVFVAFDNQNSSASSDLFLPSKQLTLMGFLMTPLEVNGGLSGLFECVVQVTWQSSMASVMRKSWHQSLFWVLSFYKLIMTWDQTSLMRSHIWRPFWLNLPFKYLPHGAYRGVAVICRVGYCVQAKLGHDGWDSSASVHTSKRYKTFIRYWFSCISTDLKSRHFCAHGVLVRV